MKKVLGLVSILTLLSLSVLQADALKNSLNNMLGSDDSSGMVNLNGLDFNKKVVKPVFKSRSSRTVIATVNGKKILKKEADRYLKTVTAGKVKDFDRLAKNQRYLLVKDLARPIVLNAAMEREVSDKEKEMVYQQIWIEKQRANIVVSTDEMMMVYNGMKQQALAENARAIIPPFITLGKQLKMKVIENKIMMNLLKNVKIKVSSE